MTQGEESKAQSEARPRRSSSKIQKRQNPPESRSQSVQAGAKPQTEATSSPTSQKAGATGLPEFPARSPENPSSTELDRLDFLKAQLTYFASHLRLADAKAAGVMVFAVTVSGVTADRLEWSGLPAFFSPEALALAALLVSGLAVIFALTALWPRTAPGRSKLDVFSWVGVAAYSKKGSHKARALTATEEDVLRAIADTTESLALVIDRKYKAIRKAFWALIPSTLAHVIYWSLK